MEKLSIFDGKAWAEKRREWEPLSVLEAGGNNLRGAAVVK